MNGRNAMMNMDCSSSTAADEFTYSISTQLFNAFERPYGSLLDLRRNTMNLTAEVLVKRRKSSVLAGLTERSRRL